MKKVIALLLAVVMLCSLTACDLGVVSMEDLCGVWEMELYQDADTAKTILENLEFYESEIALVDLNSLACVMCVQFNEDKTYSYYFDIDATKAAVRVFLDGVMDDIYAGRESLIPVYKEDLVTMTQDGFNQFYADLFGADTLDELLDDFVEYAFDYNALAEIVEEGTFRIVLKDIYKTPKGKTEEESMGCALDGDTLTLTYIDGDEVYTRR